MANYRQNTSPKIGFFKSLYLPKRFFIALAICVITLFLCYPFPFFIYFAIIEILAFIILIIIDILSVYRNKRGIEAYRICPERLSNGDQNVITLKIKNNYTFLCKDVLIIEEVPFQFQQFDSKFNIDIDSNEEYTQTYELRPTLRGIYSFGHINIFVNGVLGLITRRYILGKSQTVAVYPAFIEMQRYELMAASNRLTDYGVKRIRRVGHATEFDQIKHYVYGDDPRTINYKATARTNQLMVNTYEEEKSQPVYCLIDKGRAMKMPFNGLTLLDYAINSSLMVVSTALQKGDKVGLITFSKSIDDIIPADRNRKQRNIILESLYAQKTDFKEPDYEKLCVLVRRKLNQRSLIILYTNFETLSATRRQLKYLKTLTKSHLVLVALFENTEFSKVLDSKIKTVEDAFMKGTAEKMSNDKRLIVKELNRHGIHTIISKPEELTINSINKYLEFKARGVI